MFSLKNKIVMITVFFALNINSQPYLFNVQWLNDSTGFGPYRLDKVNLNNGSITPFINLSETFYNYSLLPANDWIVIENKCCYSKIYSISDSSDYIDVPDEYGCFGGGILFSEINNKIYRFEGSYYEIEQLYSIDVSTGIVDSLFSLPYSYNQPLGNQEAFLSSGEDI